MASSDEISESGAPVIRHSKTTEDASLSPLDQETMEGIERHIEKHLGPIHMVYHEIVSELVHLDIYWIKPNKKRNVNILVTVGMSSRAMKVPAEMAGYEYAELVFLLPPDWPLEKDDFNKEENYWPVRLLKGLGRLPHTYDTWLGYGHTVENGDPPVPYAPNVRFISSIVLPPISLGEDFYNLVINPNKRILFYAIVPIHKDELEVKMKKGADALTAQFDKHRISEILDVNRVSSCARKKILGIW